MTYRTMFFALAGLVGVALVTLPQAVFAADAPVVVTAQGKLQGETAKDVLTFFGVPYAAPPVQDLRWRPPAPAASWTGIRKATTFANHCPQNQPSLFAVPSTTEDCLYLNIFTPAADAAKRPVMVWFHGGGLNGGENDDYDGSALARRGVVVVIINYRLGLLGFFAHAALDHEGHNFGNYGFMDQQFALRWVQQNIANFGGDPKNVTISGQSGGGTSVLANLASPTAAGLFQKAINQSGTHMDVTPLPKAESYGSDFARGVGCADQTADCLRRLPVAKILDAQVGFLLKSRGDFFIQDGTVIAATPFEAFQSGKFNRVPILNGMVADEEAFSLPEIRHGPPQTDEKFDKLVDAYGPQNAALIRAEYPRKDYPDASLAQIAVIQGERVCIARRLDAAWSRFVPVYVYQFNDSTAPSYLQPLSFRMGAYHSSELQYLFPLFHGGRGTAHALNPAQTKLSEQMQAYWAQFMKGGDPNAAGSPSWVAYRPERDNVLWLDIGKADMTDGYGAVSYPVNKHNDCAMWDKITVLK